MNLESDIETNNSEVSNERNEKQKLDERIRSLKLDLGKLTPPPSQTTPQKQNGWSFGQSDPGFGNGFTPTNQDPFGQSSGGDPLQ